jgi:hypothetical protein
MTKDASTIRLILQAVILMLYRLSFKREQLPEQNGTFVDSRDNHEYKEVRISKPVWMADNFANCPVIYPDSSPEGFEVSQFEWIITINEKEKIVGKKQRNCVSMVGTCQLMK